MKQVSWFIIVIIVGIAGLSSYLSQQSTGKIILDEQEGINLQEKNFQLQESGNPTLPQEISSLLPKEKEEESPTLFTFPSSEYPTWKQRPSFHIVYQDNPPNARNLRYLNEQREDKTLCRDCSTASIDTDTAGGVHFIYDNIFKKELFYKNTGADKEEIIYQTARTIFDRKIIVSQGIPYVFFTVQEGFDNNQIYMAHPGTPATCPGSKGWICHHIMNYAGDWLDVIDLENAFGIAYIDAPVSVGQRYLRYLEVDLGGTVIKHEKVRQVPGSSEISINTEAPLKIVYAVTSFESAWIEVAVRATGGGWQYFPVAKDVRRGFKFVDNKIYGVHHVQPGINQHIKTLLEIPPQKDACTSSLCTPLVSVPNNRLSDAVKADANNGKIGIVFGYVGDYGQGSFFILAHPTKSGGNCGPNNTWLCALLPTQGSGQVDDLAIF